MVAAGHPADRLLHQRAAEVVDAPAQRLGGGVQAHLDPAGLQVGDGLAQRQAERGGVLEVLLAGDLLHAVGAAQQRLERDERQRHELGEAAGALLQLADDAHVLGQLGRLLDVAEHDGRGRADPLADATPRSPRPSARPAACWARSARGRRRAAPRRRCRGSTPGPPRCSRANTSRGRQAADVAHVRDLHRRVGVQVQLRRDRLGEPQPVQVVVQPPVGVDPRLDAQLGGAELQRIGDPLRRTPPRSARRRPASAWTDRSRRTRSRRCRRWRR